MENTNKDSLRYKSRHNENPYINKSLNITLHNKNKEKHTLLNIPLHDNIKQLQISSVTSYRIVDTDKFIKIYSETAGNWLSLSRPAQRVLAYVIAKLEKNRDSILIDMSALSEYTGYSSQGPLYGAINELIESQLLARSAHDLIYYINPNFIYNGDRMLLGELIEKSDPDRPLAGGDLKDWL